VKENIEPASAAKLGKEFELDETIRASLPDAVKKGADARGTFDAYAIKIFEAALNDRIRGLSETLATGEAATAARAATVVETTAAAEAAANARSACKTAQEEALVALKAAEVSLKEATKAVKVFEPESKSAAAELAAATGALAKHQDSSMTSYTDLVEFTKPVPVIEEAAPVEATA